MTHPRRGRRPRANPQHRPTTDEVPWTPERVRALGLTTDVVTAGAILGVGRNTSYRLVREGRFPVTVLLLGGRRIVVVAHLLRLLGVDE